MCTANKPIQPADLYIYLVLVRPRAHHQHLQPVRVDVPLPAIEAASLRKPSHRDHASSSSLVQQAAANAAFAQLRADTRSTAARLRARSN